MDFELIYHDEPLTIRAEVKKDSVSVLDGEQKIEFAYTSPTDRTYLLSRDGKNQRVIAVKENETIYIATPKGQYIFRLPATGDQDTFAGEGGPHGDKSKLLPPMPGKVVKVFVTIGQKVRAKEKLVIVEAMKMENPVVAPYDAEVVKVNCSEGQLVDTEEVLVELKELEK